MSRPDPAATERVRARLVALRAELAAHATCASCDDMTTLGTEIVVEMRHGGAHARSVPEWLAHRRARHADALARRIAMVERLLALHGIVD